MSQTTCRGEFGGDDYSFGRIFALSLPVMLGFIPLGMAFGILAKSTGVSIFIAMSLSLITYAGAGQFAFLSMISAGAGFFEIALASYFINLRHSFYAMALLKQYRGLGFRIFNIFALTDESFAVFKSLNIADVGIRTKVFSLINLLTYLYWALGTLMGYVAGSSIGVDYSGIEFCLTSLFIVLALEMFRANPSKPALSFSILAGVFGLAFLPDKFMLVVSIIACFVFVLFFKDNM